MFANVPTSLGPFFPSLGIAWAKHFPARGSLFFCEIQRQTYHSSKPLSPSRALEGMTKTGRPVKQKPHQQQKTTLKSTKHRSKIGTKSIQNRSKIGSRSRSEAKSALEAILNDSGSNLEPSWGAKSGHVGGMLAPKNLFEGSKRHCKTYLIFSTLEDRLGTDFRSILESKMAPISEQN